MCETLNRESTSKAKTCKVPMEVPHSKPVTSRGFNPKEPRAVPMLTKRRW